MAFDRDWWEPAGRLLGRPAVGAADLKQPQLIMEGGLVARAGTEARPHRHSNTKPQGLTFKQIGGGLTIGVLPWTPDGKPVTPPAELTGFAIAGNDHNWVWAKATLDGATVVVSSDQVAAPVAVRYGWADNPPVNLYNKEGLPASPFRTDS